MEKNSRLTLVWSGSRFTDIDNKVKWKRTLDLH